ncbi:hypothetical protein HK097_008803 [Rhizophlyctis rosea]|uniref:Uncharacterized protein n=1 Tax=Rhizophlyctis rosea TaxID=64517 RepID=A0AAD5SI17_9FUNG|nr:hypothetical protein HK097_008803 [Rhizophlyctis rosea]
MLRWQRSILHQLPPNTSTLYHPPLLKLFRRTTSTTPTQPPTSQTYSHPPRFTRNFPINQTPESSTHLVIYVLPTLHNRFVFHPRVLRPRSPFERALLFAVIVFRKWRYNISDFFAYGWQGFGAWAYGRAGNGGGDFFKKLWWAGNRVSTRRAADEYFFKMIPRISETVEFVYPPSINIRHAKEQLTDWLAFAPNQKSKLFLWSISFPTILYLAKFLFSPANALFSYTTFRVTAHWRANSGSKLLQSLVDHKRIIWTPSEEFEKMIVDASEKVTREMEVEVEKRGGGGNGQVWRWRPDGDVHDEVVEALEKELRTMELGRTYRRARMQYFIYDGKER